MTETQDEQVRKKGLRTRLRSLLVHASIIIRSGKVFLAVVIAVSALKLTLSALAPASFDLRDIVRLFYSENAPIGPWVALYPPLYAPGITKDSINAWVLSAPVTTDPNSMLLSLLFRLPIFAFDIGTMWVLYLTAAKLGSVQSARLVSLIWYLNPYALLSTELIGVPDIVAVFLTTLSLYLILSRRLFKGAAILALGISIKLFPILLIPPILLSDYSRGFSRKQFIASIGVTSLGLLGYLSWTVSSGLRIFTDYTPVSQPFLFNSSPLVGVGYTVSGYAFGMVLFYCLLVLFAKRDLIIPTLISTFVAFYVLSSPFPEYFMWTLPIMAIDVVLFGGRRAILVAIFYATAFVEWFLTSSAFLTPSGYSLLLIPLGIPNPPAYAIALQRFLENNPLLGAIILPLLYTGLFSSIVIYAIDLARSWFGLKTTKPA